MNPCNGRWTRWQRKRGHVENIGWQRVGADVLSKVYLEWFCESSDSVYWHLFYCDVVLSVPGDTRKLSQKTLWCLYIYWRVMLCGSLLFGNCVCVGPKLT